MPNFIAGSLYSARVWELCYQHVTPSHCISLDHPSEGNVPLRWQDHRCLAHLATPASEPAVIAGAAAPPILLFHQHNLP